MSEKGEASNTGILLAPKWHAGPAISCKFESVFGRKFYNSRGNLWGYGPFLNLSKGGIVENDSNQLPLLKMIENLPTFDPSLNCSHPDMERFSQLPPCFKRLVDLEALHVRLQSAGVHPQPRFARDARAPTAQATTGFPGQVDTQVLVVDVLNAGAFRTCQRKSRGENAASGGTKWSGLYISY